MYVCMRADLFSHELAMSLGQIWHFYGRDGAIVAVRAWRRAGRKDKAPRPIDVRRQHHVSHVRVRRLRHGSRAHRLGVHRRHVKHGHVLVRAREHAEAVAKVPVPIATDAGPLRR